MQAYSPLVRMQKSDDPTLVKIAKEVGKEPTQVLIRWSLQKGYVSGRDIDTVESAIMCLQLMTPVYANRFSPLPKSDTPCKSIFNQE